MTTSPRANLSELLARVADLIEKVQWLGQLMTDSSTEGDQANVQAVIDQTNAFVAAVTSGNPLSGFVDGLEALITALNAKADTLATLIGASNTALGSNGSKLDAINASLSRTAPWNAQADSGALLLNNTSKLLKAAPGANLRLRITALQLSNANLVTGATVQILDGASQVWFLPIAGAFTGGFPVDIIGSVNTAFNVRLAGTITGGVAVNAQGTVVSA